MAYRENHQGMCVLRNWWLRLQIKAGRQGTTHWLDTYMYVCMYGFFGFLEMTAESKTVYMYIIAGVAFYS